MKKTLLLMALLGTMTATTRAEEVWAEGLDATKAENYTCSKYDSTYPYTAYDGVYDYNMCFAASASSTLAWWQDRVEKSGALIIPKDAPRGEAIWDKIRKEWQNKEGGGQAGHVLQYYLSGVTGYSNNSSWLTPLGEAFAETGGYYPHLKGADYDFQGTNIYPEGNLVQYVDCKGINCEYGASYTSYAGASALLVQRLNEGYGGILLTDEHAMAFYGVEINTDGLITKIWYHDNNLTSSDLREAEVFAGPPNKNTEEKTIGAYVGYGNNIRSFSLLRSKDFEFDVYELTFDGVADEELFSHYLNITVDGTEYELQYDLRDAQQTGSPVIAKTQEGSPITTGNITLKDGELSLVKGVGEYDGGGKTSGTITFDEKSGATRVLSVQHTDTIAAEIKVNAASGNTLDVAQDTTATFGKLTGTGDLDKIGKGTAEVTDEVSLVGDIHVREGAFIFGKDAEFTGTRELTVAKGASLQGQDITLSFTGGVHENNGTMALATTVKNGAVLKGSGTFGDVAVQDGGRLIVGSSPGRQEILGNLSVNMGEIVFGVSGWDTSANAENVGWSSGAYSNIVMHGGSLTLGDGSQIRFGVGNGALAALLASDSGTAFSMTIATGFGNKDYFTSQLLQQLAAQTIFYVTDEAGANIANDAGLKAGDALNTRITDLKYSLVDNTKLCVTGVYWAAEPVVPEPATATLSLLALVALASRRRKN